MITKTDIASFWGRFFGIQALYLIVILTGIVLFPIAYFIRHVLKIEGKRNPFWWWLNYTEDNDWGLDHYKDNTPKKTFWNAVKWYARNPAWNFILLFRPKWKAGETQEFATIKNTLPGKWDWADRDEGPHGTNHCYYRIDGTVYGRYSRANKNIEFQMGAAGYRYKFLLKM